MQPRLAAPPFLGQTTPQLPPSLLAPRYSHLLEEAKSSSKQDSLGTGSRSPGESPAPLTPAADDRPVDGMTSHVKQEESEQEIPLTPSVRSRVKGFLFSYLPSHSQEEDTGTEDARARSSRSSTSSTRTVGEAARSDNNATA